MHQIIIQALINIFGSEEAMLDAGARAKGAYVQQQYDWDALQSMMRGGIPPLTLEDGAYHILLQNMGILEESYDDGRPTTYILMEEDETITAERVVELISDYDWNDRSEEMFED